MQRNAAILCDFENIVSKLDEALAAPKSDLARDSAILRFELAFELAWKLIQQFASKEAFEINSPRQAFERAFQPGWISDEILWKEILQQRNMAVHVYREALAESLYRQLGNFSVGFKELLNSISKT